MHEVFVTAQSIERFRPLVGDEVFDEFSVTVERGRSRLAGRTIWNINSTAAGGGVAEMLQTLIAYVRGAEVDSRWLVIGGDPPFYSVTKRIHNGLHGSPGDGGPLGAAEHDVYDRVTAQNHAELRALVQDGDVVILHDPQTAGLVAPMQQIGAKVIWRCHVGVDDITGIVADTWNFLRHYLEGADAYIFSRGQYAPDWVDRELLNVVPPSIDPFSVKNQQVDDATVNAILCRVGILQGVPEVPPMFVRRDGTPGRIDRVADIVRAGPPPYEFTPLVVQVSRWDHLKDMEGVMRGFAMHAAEAYNAQLALVGPNVSGVTDDPEGGQVLDECTAAWRDLPLADRRRIQLVCLPMNDVEENAAIVNALQRHAAIVVQKSLQEGFGLTVAEAMWKSRPVIGSGVGGIQDQIVDGESGVLIRDPADVDSFGRACAELVSEPDRREKLGAAAYERVRDQFLATRHLAQYEQIATALVE